MHGMRIVPYIYQSIKILAAFAVVYPSDQAWTMSTLA